MEQRLSCKIFASMTDLLSLKLLISPTVSSNSVTLKGSMYVDTKATPCVVIHFVRLVCISVECTHNDACFGVRFWVSCCPVRDEIGVYCYHLTLKSCLWNIPAHVATCIVIHVCIITCITGYGTLNIENGFKLLTVLLLICFIWIQVELINFWILRLNIFVNVGAYASIAIGLQVWPPELALKHSWRAYVCASHVTMLHCWWLLQK